MSPAPSPRIPLRTDGPAVEITYAQGKLLVKRMSDNKVLYSDRSEVGLRTSPGRRYLVALREATHEIISLPLVDGEAAEHVLLAYPSDRRFVLIGWGPEGTSIVYALRSTDGSASDEIWVRPNGSEPRRIFAAPRIEGPAMSPDGRHIAFRDRSETRGEVWILEK
jgi:hypothetical protein